MRKLKLIAFLGLAAAALATVTWIARAPTAEERALVAAVENGDVVAVASALRHGGVERVLRQRGTESNLLLRAIGSKHYQDEEQRLRVVVMLLDAGAEMEDERAALSPVQKAVAEGHPAIMEALLAKGAESKDLFRFAVSCNELSMAQAVFSSGAKPDFHDDAPVQAAKQANAQMLAWLYQIGYPHGNEHGESPELIAAVASDCTDCVAMLLDAGVSFGLKEHPNILARWFQHIGQTAGPNTLAVFVQHGLELERGGEAANTLLHYAARGGRVDTIKWLLAHGLKVDARNEFGETPLMLAAELSELDAIRTLLEAKADISLSDKDLRTAKRHTYREDGYNAEARAATVALLEQYGANEYIGESMPPSRFDSEVERDFNTFDVTKERYASLPMLAPNARFFNVTLKGRMSSSDYAVLPGGKVLRVQSIPDLVEAGLRLRTKDDALNFVRTLSEHRLPLRDSTDFIEMDMPAERRCFIAPPINDLLGMPKVEQRGSGAQAVFVIRRIVAPRSQDFFGTEIHAKVVEEKLSAAGAYDIRTLRPNVEYHCEPFYPL